MPLSAVAAILCEQVVHFEYRDGLYFATDERGVRAYFPRDFLRSFHDAAAIIQRANTVETAEIIPLEPQTKFERVYPRDKSA